MDESTNAVMSISEAIEIGKNIVIIISIVYGLIIARKGIKKYIQSYKKRGEESFVVTCSLDDAQNILNKINVKLEK